MLIMHHAMIQRISSLKSMRILTMELTIFGAGSRSNALTQLKATVYTLSITMVQYISGGVGTSSGVIIEEHRPSLRTRKVSWQEPLTAGGTPPMQNLEHLDEEIGAPKSPPPPYNSLPVPFKNQAQAVPFTTDGTRSVASGPSQTPHTPINVMPPLLLQRALPIDSSTSRRSNPGDEVTYKTFTADTSSIYGNAAQSRGRLPVEPDTAATPGGNISYTFPANIVFRGDSPQFQRHYRANMHELDEETSFGSREDLLREQMLLSHRWQTKKIQAEQQIRILEGKLARQSKRDIQRLRELEMQKELAEQQNNQLLDQEIMEDRASFSFFYIAQCHV